MMTRYAIHGNAADTTFLVYSRNSEILAMEEKLEAAVFPKFPFFPLLVAELRLKIWEFALPGPRVVDIYYDAATDKFYERKFASGLSMLYVNHESRGETLKLYKPYFGTPGYCARIWLNLTFDTVSLNYDTFRNRKLGIRELSGIENLELRDRLMHVVKARDLFRHLRLLRSLKTVVVVDPRCPFIPRPYPTVPSFGPTSWVFELDLEEFYKGLDLERECADVWDKLVVLKRALVQHWGEGEVDVGMVGILNTGERRYKMVPDGA
jgi:hypothetical protein